VDAATTPILELWSHLLRFSAQNSASGRLLIEKQRAMSQWRNEFHAKGIESINLFVRTEMDALRAAIPSFVEQHFEKKELGNLWKDLVESRQFNAKAHKLQEHLHEHCSRRLQKIAREVQADMHRVAAGSASKDVHGEPVVDYRRAWNWGVIVVGGGLAVAAGIFVAGSIGVAATVVGIAGPLFSVLFDSRETRARKLRESLTSALTEDVNKMEQSLQRKLVDWLQHDLVDGQVRRLESEIQAMITVVFDLADVQRKLAWKLNGVQKGLHRELLRAALRNFDEPALDVKVRDVARVPGFGVVLVTTPDAADSSQTCGKLEKLMGEKVWVVVDSDDPLTLLRQVVGKAADGKRVRVEKKISVAHIQARNLNGEARARINLAQQLTQLHIIESN
jgi:hypothetical protein